MFCFANACLVKCSLITFYKEIIQLLWISAVVNVNSLERDGLRQAELCPRHTMKMNTKNTLIPDRLYKGIGMLKLGRMHRQTGEKFVDPTAM